MKHALLALPILLAACAPEQEVSGAVYFAENCAACHGPAGNGAGELAEWLDTPPADLRGLSARNGGTFPLVEVMSTIDGFQRGEHFAPQMPEFGAGDLGPTVIVDLGDGAGTPVPATLLALAEYLQSIQQP